MNEKSTKPLNGLHYYCNDHKVWFPDLKAYRTHFKEVFHAEE